MRTLNCFRPGFSRTFLQTCFACIACLLFLILPSCQKYDDDFSGRERTDLTDTKLIPKVQDNSADIYFGPVTFKRLHRAPCIVTMKIENPDFELFDDNFVLKIRNGCNRFSRVASAEIRIDDKIVVWPYDFSKNISFICKKITGLNPGSVLKVKLNGTPGSFLVLWIEGTKKVGEVSDVDGNIYKTLKIGDQWWMTENLKVTKYSNGDLIGTTTPANLNITAEATPKYQWAYKGNEGYTAAFGRLYTWYTVTDSRGICPAGWHVPSDEDWTILTEYLVNNGYGFEGSGTDIGKSVASISGWRDDPIPGNVGNDQSVNNSSGFNGVPGGDRLSNGMFINLGAFAGWWSITEYSAANAWYRGMFYNMNGFNRTNDSKKYGGAVRCVKD